MAERFFSMPGREPSLVGEAQGSRLALVIGNGAYPAGRLENPTQDARLIADTLRTLGFAVELLLDAGKSAMEHAIVEFGQRVEQAGPQAITFVYFAGHGLQDEGRNYLLPTDAVIPERRFLRSGAIPLSFLVEELAGATPHANVIVLDACRHALLSQRTGTSTPDHLRGLASISNLPDATLVAYSTAANTVAKDGEGGNSPFALALARRLGEAGHKIQDVFSLVARDVSEATARQQRPAFYLQGGLPDVDLTKPEGPRLAPGQEGLPLAGPAPSRTLPSGRRLAAIVAADVVGYSARMAADEEAAVRDLKALQAAALARIAEHGGVVIDTAGDGLLSEFPSVLNAVKCALAIQEGMASRDRGANPAKAMQLRIGVEQGDVLFEQGRVYGDGINIASRLEAHAEPGGVVISGKVHEEVHGRLVASFEDLGEKSLKNIPRPIRVFAVRSAPKSAPVKAGAAPLALPDRPSIAVLPFQNMSGDPEQEYFADGMAEDIITALSRLRWLFVIARNSTFAYKGRSVDVRQIARELGVRYILEGSVRSAAQRLRITAQLIDAETGKHIWAEKYDRRLDDIFAVQDEITESTVAAIEPHLYAEEGTRVASRPPDSIDVWGLVVRAIGLINKVGRTENEEAQLLLRRAVELDPRYAKAHATLSWAVWWAALCYWTPTADGYAEAARHAEAARLHDPNDPWARMTVGLTLSTAGHHERALAELQACLNLNPSFALGHMVYGWALLRAGRFEEAIAETGRALRMSPLDSFAGLYTAIHGLALLGARRFDEALPHLRASVAAFAEYSGHYNTLISCCGHLGLVEEAQEFIALRNRVGPPLRTGVLRTNLGKFAHRDVFVEGLVKAGVPE